MNNKILVIGFACLSLVAVAQSNEKKDQSSNSAEVASPRDAASGQASGKRMHKPLMIKQDVSAREMSTGHATGKTMASDDWQAPTAKSSDPKPANNQSRVAVGDVNGDGLADTTAAKNSGHATEQNAVINNSHSNIKSPRNVATGQASEKRVHLPIAVVKDTDAGSKK
jgi:hypothetical protein